MSARYALYLAPGAETSLWRKASAWLGRDAAADCPVAFPAIAGFDRKAIAAMTADPRKYGFHATITAPFRLSAGKTKAALCDAVDRFAASRKPFSVPFEVATLSSFIALLEARPAPELTALHAAVLAAFDAFRAPLSEADMARRRLAPLSDRQLQYLERWGYPYVLDEFRVHLTLTGSLGAAERDRVATALDAYLAEELREPVPIDALTVFEQPRPDSPFVVLHRAAFTAS
jgi:putative phosphonate metabolism protein